MISPPIIRVEIQYWNLEGRAASSVQRVPVETVNFKKRIQTFKYLNKNKRWAKGEIALGADQIYFIERTR